MRFQVLPQFRHQVGFKKIYLKQSVRIQIIGVKFMKWNWSNTGMLYIPYAPCMEYLPTVAKNAWQIQVNVPDYGLSSSKRNHHLFKWWLTSRDIVWLHNSNFIQTPPVPFSNIYTFANCTTMTFQVLPQFDIKLASRKYLWNKASEFKSSEWNLWSEIDQTLGWCINMLHVWNIYLQLPQMHAKYM